MGTEKTPASTQGSPLDEFKRFLTELGPEFDARVEEAVNELNGTVPPVDWVDDPDPFGLGWEWLRAPSTD